MKRSVNSIVWGLRHGVGIREVRAFPPAGRSFRSVVLLAVLSVFNFFDLAFTHSQLPRGNFAEANVLAADVVQGGGPGPIAFKLMLFALGATILYHYRQRWQSEVGLWGITTAYGALMVWWLVYLRVVETCVHDPAVLAPFATF